MRRVPELESLRGLAALSILIYHLRPQVYDWGWPRVDLFLVLTGFLITSMVFKYGQTPGFLGVLWVRRIFRIWPAYYLALLVMVVANPSLPKPFPMHGLPYYLTFTQNVPLFWSAHAPAFNWYFEHTWSLALDAQFVLIWTVVVRRVERSWLVPLTVGLVVTSTLLRAEGYHPWLLPARCDGYALGGLLAVFFHDTAWMERHRRAFRRVLSGIALGAPAVLIAAKILLERPDYSAPMTFGPSLRIALGCLFYAALVGLALSYSGHPALAVLRSRPMCYLGRISYGVYVFHAMVFVAIVLAANRLGLRQTPALEVVMVAATLGFAALVWEAFERPILTYRDRFRFQVGAADGVRAEAAVRLPIPAPAHRTVLG